MAAIFSLSATIVADNKEDTFFFLAGVFETEDSLRKNVVSEQVHE